MKLVLRGQTLVWLRKTTTTMKLGLVSETRLVCHLTVSDPLLLIYVVIDTGCGNDIPLPGDHRQCHLTTRQNASTPCGTFLQVFAICVVWPLSCHLWFQLIVSRSQTLAGTE